MGSAVTVVDGQVRGYAAPMADYFMPAVAAALGVGISFWLQSRRNKKVAVQLEPALRAHGPQTLHGLAERVGMNSFMGRGRVVLALNELIAAGQVVVNEAPAGTPQLEKVNHITYRWAGGDHAAR